MTRIFKGLGLAMAATAVMVAVMASPAQAATGALTAEKYPAIITGEQLAGVTFDIDEPAIKTVECEFSLLDATLVGQTDPVTFTPTYQGCTAEPGEMPVTITTNGCDYVFGFGKAVGTTGEIQVSVNCPAGKKIEIHVYENAAKHALNVSLCRYDIGAQGPVAGGEYHNLPGMPGDVLLTVSAKLTAERAAGAGAVCGAPAFPWHLPIRLTGSYTMRAFEDNFGAEGFPIGVDAL